jgi:hypothetical protein
LYAFSRYGVVDCPNKIVVRTFDFDKKPRTEGGDTVDIWLVQKPGAAADAGVGGGSGAGSGGGGSGGGAAAGRGPNAVAMTTAAGTEVPDGAVLGTFTDHQDGTYTCNYTPLTAEGDWQLEVR